MHAQSIRHIARRMRACVRPLHVVLVVVGLLLAAMGTGTAGAQPRRALVPLPARLEASGGMLAIRGGFTVSMICQDSTAIGGVSRFLARLSSVSRGTQEQGSPDTPLTIRCDPARAGDRASIAEQYTLVVSSAGVELAATDPIGVLRGLATLLQLVEQAETRVSLPFVRIEDRPVYPWRSVMLDVARHFISIETIRKQVDAMELAKLNVLHLHLSDNEAFRLRSERLPRLGRSNADGQSYTVQELRALVAYAAARGVRVVPEIDVPGHSRALLAVYPQLASARPGDGARAPGRDVLDPSNPAVYALLDTLFGEVADIFPGEYLHAGGDEVAAAAWTGNPRISSYMATQRLPSACALQAHFTTRLHRLLRAHGRRMIGWDELIDCGTPPKDVVIQSWRSSTRTAAALRAGHQTIVSAGYYLDWLLPAAASYAVDPADPNGHGFSDDTWARIGRSRLRTVVGTGFRLRPGAPLTPAERGRLLGGTAPLWAESVTEDMVGDRLWPRAAAIAERLWSPAGSLDSASLNARLRRFDAMLGTLGLGGAADRSARLRRLAPDAESAAAVATLVSVMEPVKVLARLLAERRTGAPLVLTRIADLASPESAEGNRFAEDIEIALRGRWTDRTLRESIRTRLIGWRDNHEAFMRASRGRPLLEEARAASVQLRDLATVGLRAVDAMIAGRALDPADDAAARRAIDQADRARAASRDLAAAVMEPQPPGYLLVSIAPSVARLVAAARTGGAGHE